MGTRANQNFFKLGLGTHENGPMRLFGSRVILEVERQKPKLIFWSQNVLGKPYEREQKSEKKGEKGEKGEGRKRVRAKVEQGEM